MDAALEKNAGCKPFNELLTPEEQFRAFGHLLICMAELMVGKKPELSVLGSDGRMHSLSFSTSRHRVRWEEAGTGRLVSQAEEVSSRYPDLATLHSNLQQLASAPERAASL